MHLANSIKYTGALGAITEIASEVFMDARIIHFADFIELVTEPKKWIARLPFSNCLLNFNDKWCVLAREQKKGVFIPGLEADDVVIDFYLFRPVEDGAELFLCDMFVLVTKDGVVKQNSDGKCIYLRRPDGKELRPQDEQAGISTVMMCLTHLTLLNCKNIDLERITQADDKVNQRRLREGKKPFYSYYVASIKGNKGVGRVTPTGNRAHWRFHLCRGHFKQRKTGRFWWSQHARGDKDLGSIVKDYKVDSSVAV